MYLVNRSGNRPSSEGAAARFDQARALCQDAGFRRITFRGDTDFSQTEHLDRWDAARVRFIFGYAARANLIREADALPARAWTPLVRRPSDDVQTAPHHRPVNVKFLQSTVGSLLRAHTVRPSKKRHCQMPTANAATCHWSFLTVKGTYTRVVSHSN